MLNKCLRILQKYGFYIYIFSFRSKNKWHLLGENFKIFLKCAFLKLVFKNVAVYLMRTLDDILLLTKCMTSK